MKVTNSKNCHCHTCARDFHYLGITKHRAMHRDKMQDCKITFTHGDTYTYEFSKKSKSPNVELTGEQVKDKRL